MLFVNYYACPYGTHWIDRWSCCCDDRCPNCNREIQPYHSDDAPEEENMLTGWVNDR